MSQTRLELYKRLLVPIILFNIKGLIFWTVQNRIIFSSFHFLSVAKNAGVQKTNQ
jgi:hypothetical protein